jgi:hypothetical protein
MKATKKMMMKVMVDNAAAELNPCRIWLMTRMDRVVVLFAPPVRMYGRSNMRSASSVRKRMATISAGFTSGRVIIRNRCQAVAPSTFAAS